MALKAVVFDVGETLVDEERWWRRLADRGGSAAARRLGRARRDDRARRGAHALWGHLGIDQPTGWWRGARTRWTICTRTRSTASAGLRELGLRAGIVGNQTEALEAWARDAALPADVISSSASLGVRKPEPAFFARVVELMECSAAEVAYVGDRVDNDVLPAAAAGLVAVHVRRGPWGRLQATPPEAAVGLDDLASLPEALASLG